MSSPFYISVSLLSLQCLLPLLLSPFTLSTSVGAETRLDPFTELNDPFPEMTAASSESDSDSEREHHHHHYHTRRNRRQISFLKKWFEGASVKPSSLSNKISNEPFSNATHFGGSQNNGGGGGGGSGGKKSSSAVAPAPVSERDNRFLSLFTVVRFNNEACMSASGDNGTCYPAAECSRRGGAANGKCAQGYGACCVFSKSCGGQTNQNCTYFTHNGYPSSFDGTGSCQLTVYKCAPDVCQLKLEFDSFNIAQPGSNGVCNNDQFIVSGSSTAVPIICGVNTGNHMYVDIGVDSSPVTLSVITSGPTYSRSWKIKVSQIKCTSLTRGPEGCLQYFRGVSGVIRSYNFDFTGGQQLSNQDYTACVRLERNFCGIRYTACSDNGDFGFPNAGGPVRARSFTLTGQLANAGTGVGAITGSSNCATDWITIPCATNTGRIMQMNGAVCQDRLCGDIFNSEGGGATNQVPVYSYAKPFRITYHTDSNETNDSGNRGFCLNYIQQPCTPQQ